MPVQSINLTSAVRTTFNGVDVTKINLNGTQVWVKPSVCKTISSPYVQNIPSILLSSAPPPYSPIGSIVALHTFNVTGMQCANRYRFELPVYPAWLYISFYVKVSIKFYAGSTLIHTSPTFDGTSASFSAAVNYTGVIPKGTTKFVVRLSNGNVNYWSCSSSMRAGTLKLWGE